MTRRVRALAVAAILPLSALGLSGCVPPPADYTESEWPKNLRLDPAPAQLALGFASGSSRMRPGDLARLRASAGGGGLVLSDRVVVAVAGPPELASARFEAVAAALLPYGIVPSRVSLAASPPDAAVIRRERYMVTLPPCPDWSKPAAGAGDFTNTASSNFGCAAAVNLGLMIAQPADLVEPRQVGMTDARPAVDAVNNYRLGKVQLPPPANIGPIAVPAIQAPPAPPPAGAAGAGGSGAQP
ncbi:MAG: CpaD family pilus assembly lipoprotein [Alphaproteobacteria bacterium]